MNIVHIIPNLAKGGAERLCIDTCNELIKNGHKVLLVVLEELIEFDDLSSQVELYICSEKISLHLLSKNEIKLNLLENKIKKFKPDVLHAHLYLGALYSATIEYKVTRFIHLHSNYEEFARISNNPSIKQKIIHQYERNFFLKQLRKNKFHFISISKSSDEYILNELSLSRNKVTLLPNAIIFNKFSFERTYNNKFNLISVGNLKEEKGYPLIIETISELKKITNSEIQLTVLGQGSMLKELEGQARKLNVSKNISFEGSVHNPEDYLKLSNLFIHGTKSEAFGLVLIEAMASGLPVISTDGNGNRDFMDGSNGILLDHRNPKRFAKEIYELMLNSERYKKLQSGAIKTAKKYDIINYVHRLEQIYKSVLDEK